MATQPVTPQRLTLQLEQNGNETIVHCAGRINAENSEMFQEQISSLIPESSTQNAATPARIVLDLSSIAHVDSSGLAHSWVYGRRRKIKAAILKWQT